MRRIRALLGLGIVSAIAAGCAAGGATDDARSTDEDLLLPPIARYTFRIDQINITNTRAVHNDTDVVSTAVKANGVDVPATTKDIGDVNNGTHDVYLPATTIYAASGTKVNLGFLVVNSGYDRSNEKLGEEVFDGLSDVAKEVANALYPSGVWALVDQGIHALNGVLAVDCDGTVAADEIQTDGATLASWTASTGQYGEWRHYAGSNSPVGCGSNSSYWVHWTVVKEGATQKVDDFAFSDARETTALGDWKVNSYKAECADGEAVKGISLDTRSSRTHTALCRTGTSSRASFPHQSCRAIDFSHGDSRRTGSTGDWDRGFYKGECGSSEYVAGVSQSTDGKINGVLCCSGATPHASCSAEALNGWDARESTTTGDWDVNYYKAECGDGRYVAGISRSLSTGAPHAVLCCN